MAVRVDGGGLTRGADACKLGIARALKKFDTGSEAALRETWVCSTRDSRMKDARSTASRRPPCTQFSKR